MQQGRKTMMGWTRMRCDLLMTIFLYKLLLVCQYGVPEGAYIDVSLYRSFSNTTVLKKIGGKRFWVNKTKALF